MDTSQLECMIQCDPYLNQSIVGVYPADYLPKTKIRRPFGFIANTDIGSKPGEHWCAFFSPCDGYFEFFDSYGRSPRDNNPRFEMWLDINARIVERNDFQIQSDISSLCGLYCILFLRYRCAGYSYRDFIKTFSVTEYYNNDAYVMDTVTTAYSHCISHQTFCNQTCKSLKECK